MPLRVTAEEERKGLFSNKPRVSASSKRKISVDEEEPRRRSSAETVVPPPKAVNIAPRLVAMCRKHLIPSSDYEYAMLGDGVFTDLELTNAAKMTSMLKLISPHVELFASRWYLYTRNPPSKRSLTPTPYWSRNWPSDSIMV